MNRNNDSNKKLALYTVVLFALFAAAIGFWRQSAPSARRVVSPNALFVRAVEEGDTDHVRLFLDYDPLTANATRPVAGVRLGSADTRDRYRATPVLVIAVRNRNELLTRLLLLHGAKVNTPGQFGITPLLVAAQNGDARLTALLLQHGADPNVREKIFDETPLHRVSFRRRIDRPSNALHVARLLLAAGADPRAKDRRGRTPSDAAKRAGLSSIVQCLQEAAIAKN